MKLLSRLVIALAICLVAVPAMASMAPVQAYYGDISLSPDEGYVGDEIEVSGDDVGYYRVWIYYELYNEDEDDWPFWKVNCEEEVVGEPGEQEIIYYFEKDIVIPKSCMGEHEIRLCYDDDPDDEIDTTNFMVHPSTEIDRDDGPAGTNVEVNGVGYGEHESEIEIRFYLKDPGTTHYDNEDYYASFGPTDINVDDYGSWKDVTFEVPSCSKGEHKIYAVGNKADDIKSDEIEFATFTIKPGISVDKSSGYVGDKVTTRGSGFGNKESGIKVRYYYDASDYTDFTVGTAHENGTWELTFEVPPSTQGKHKIDAYGEGTKATDIADKDFTVSPKIATTPAEGHIGTSITVSGNGFAGNKSITITYDGVTKSTTTTDDKGSLPSTSFKAPKSIHGNHTIAINGLTSKFVMESTPPAKPTLTSPVNDSRIGFMGKQTPTLVWSAVTDPSGVSYSLQLSYDASFSTLVIPELSGLTQESYTIVARQALPYGTYYWRVKAIDSAQNDSGWSTAYSFHSSLLPMWAFIAIIVLVVVLIGVLVYLLAIRRRRYYD